MHLRSGIESFLTPCVFNRLPYCVLRGPSERAFRIIWFFQPWYRSTTFLHRYCTFQRNEPCSLPVTVEMISAYLKKTPEEIALATTFNALKVFGLSN